MKRFVEFLRKTVKVAGKVEGFGYSLKFQWGKPEASYKLVDIQAVVLTIGVSVYVGV